MYLDPSGPMPHRGCQLQLQRGWLASATGWRIHVSVYGQKLWLSFCLCASVWALSHCWMYLQAAPVVSARVVNCKWVLACAAGVLTLSGLAEHLQAILRGKGP